MPLLGVEGVTKRYGSVAALDNLSLQVSEGECLALLGPSGCGKTTLLNIVAGFIEPDAGDIKVAGTSIAAVPPHRRGMGMVFQDYALFPHLSVMENVEFGLRMRGRPAAERRREAEQALALVGLAQLGERGVQQLSGGQRQRVAVARALAIQPRLLLFDEPLSNLDAGLRESMRTEIRSLLTRTGITALFVTHDQAEAFAVADRIALLNRGRVEQVGRPGDLYEQPATRFAAGFLGACNTLPARAAAVVDGLLTLEVDGVRLLARLPSGPCPALGALVTLVVRPHHLHPTDAGAAAGNHLAGVVETMEYLGWLTRVTLRSAQGRALLLEIPGRAGLTPGAALQVTWRAEDSWVIPGAEPA